MTVSLQFSSLPCWDASSGEIMLKHNSAIMVLLLSKTNISSGVNFIVMLKLIIGLDLVGKEWELGSKYTKWKQV